MSDRGVDTGRIIRDSFASSETADDAPMRIVPLDEFADVDEPGADVVLGGDDGPLVAERSDTMAYGDGGVGKTTLLADLGFHLAAGDDWLSIPIPTPRRVLIIEAEGPRPQFRRKLRRKRDGWKGSPLRDRLLVFEHPWGRFSFADLAWRDLLAAAIFEREIDVVIVGPLTSVGMETAGTIVEARAFLALVDEVRVLSARPVAFVFVHHENKGGKVSGAWEGVGDALWHVQQHGHGRLRLHFQKARWSSTYHQTALQLVWADGDGFALDEQEPMTAERIWDAIAEYVLAHGGCSWNAVDDDVSGNGKSKRETRDRMLADGVIVDLGGARGGMGLWHRDDPAIPLRPTLDAVMDAPASATGGAVSARLRPPRPDVREDAVDGRSRSAPPDIEDAADRANPFLDEGHDG
jgi:hypothetical protein